MAESTDTPAPPPGARPAAVVLVGLALFAALTLLSTRSFLLFHSVAEAFTIVIGTAIFLIAWNSRTFASNNYLLFIGVGYLSVSAIDLLHLLAFPGMDVISSGRGMSSQLWIAARFFEAVTLAAAPLLLRRSFRVRLVLVLYAAAATAVVWLIASGNFPATVVDGRLTFFKSASEVLIAALFAVAALLLWMRRQDVDPTVVRLVLASLAVRVASELSFVVYYDPYGVANLTGHLLKIAACYLLYKALVENMLMRPYAALFRSLKDREEQLAAAVRELETFSYSVSHDLRAPLTAVIGFGDLLKGEKPVPDGERREYATHIVRSAMRMSQIIDDLLRLGGISRADIEPAPVDLSALAAEVVQALRENERHRHRPVEVAIEPDLRVEGDARLLRTALENLVANALKFTARTGVPRIEIGAREDTGELYVRDNGAGFDPKKTSLLFTPYKRLHSDAEFAGTGIGLATVQRIVQRHGGKVRAEGEIGRGATFYLQLPGLRRESGH